MSHYYYDVLNMDTQAYYTNLTIKEAAHLTGIALDKLNKWATMTSREQATLEFEMTPIDTTWMLSRKARTALSKNFTEFEMAIFGAAWESACAPLRALQKRRDRRRQAHG